MFGKSSLLLASLLAANRALKVMAPASVAALAPVSSASISSRGGQSNRGGIFPLPRINEIRGEKELGL